MKSKILSLFITLISLSCFGQNKPNVAFAGTWDDQLSHYNYGITIFTNYVNRYDIDFNCEEYLINYIKQRLSSKYNFVEMPSDIPVFEIKNKFNSYDVQKNSLHLLDSLKNHQIDYVIRIENVKINYWGGELPISGWGIFSHAKFTKAFVSYYLSMIDVANARFGKDMKRDLRPDDLWIDNFKASNKASNRLTPEELSPVVDLLKKITKTLVDEILPYWFPL